MSFDLSYNVWPVCLKDFVSINARITSNCRFSLSGTDVLIPLISREETALLVYFPMELLSNLVVPTFVTIKCENYET